MNFIEKCLSGDAFADEIDDAVEAWSEGVEGQDLELNEFLGMTVDEYSAWMTSPSILPWIVSAHRNQRTLAQELECDRIKMAARASKPREAAQMKKWLEKIGKL
ncbi:hypothetical protein [Pseudomonas mangiferae]|uniref:Uncharacterized protein n=1 Tax=Pseudomonas mangiferae TaxID=2593654 RepID=A0A553H1M5_9PSED|nr:hypothetical protein [Pseudomonas mangiferae]TRX75654.1 hypothetical protein FM069_07900 [Pseudomonas mangiferae]